MSDNSNVELEVDISLGRFHVRADAASAPALLEKLESLFGKYLKAAAVTQTDANKNNAKPADGLGETQAAKPAGSSEDDGKVKKTTTSKASKTYKPVDLGLTEPQRAEVRTFFNEKNPSSQEEVVAVVTTKIKQLIGKEEFAPDELFSALRIVDRPIPKNLDGVVSNMKLNGRGDRKDGKLIVNYMTEDFVNHHMTQKKQAAK